MKKETIYHIIITFSSIVTVLMIWQLIATLNPTNIIPTPLELLEALGIIIFQGDNFGYNIFHHIGASLLRVIIGFFYASIIAIPLGLIMGLSKKAEWAASPIIEIFRPIPPFAWIPFALVLFGLGLISQSFVIFIGAFFPILTSSYNGVKQTLPIHVDVAKTLGANQGEILAYVIIPSALPSILVGLRIGIGVGWMCVIAAELVGLNVPLGLGYLIQYSAQFGNFGLTLASMFITGLVGFGMTYSLKLFENHALRWREQLGKN
ncbi:MAG: ABC transporter permease [Candidatus Lokiarchaeota archaeon]|nr:ABC transporter permease [Candidatus Lokiarchaeota archaeon]